MTAFRKNAALEMRRDNSRSFISDYLMDLKLREVSAIDDAEACDTSSDGILTPPRPFNGDLREGQIRLLSQPSELTYAVLLRRGGENAFVVAPFSRFPSPATDEELKTVFDGGLYLRVLQVWNIRTALDATLQKSWLVGELPRQDIEDAWKVWEWTLGGSELAESILRRTGLPVSLSSDPRNQYMHEELEKFAAFDAEDEANAEKAEESLFAAGRSRPRRSARGKSQALRASGSSFQGRAPAPNARSRLHLVAPRYGLWVSRRKLAAADKPQETSESFLVPSLNVQIDVDFSPSENKVRICVYGPDGEDDKTTLEGFVVVDKKCSTVGTIHDGFLVADAASIAKGFALLHPETGESVAVEPKVK